MEINDFKRILDSCFSEEQFEKKRSYYIKSSNEISCVVGVQKSSFSKLYYINIGYIIKTIHPSSVDFFRDIDGDLRARFTYQEGGRISDEFDLEKLSNVDYVRKQIKHNIKSLVDECLTINGIKSLLKNNPEMLYQTRMEAKQYLGLT